MHRLSVRTLSPALALPLVSVLALGCSSSGDGGMVSGQFLDSPVSNLGFAAGDVNGDTDADGGFSVPAGSTVTFRLGDVVLGSAPVEGILTPVSLVSGASDETDPTVGNMARLLQSLDSDADPQNGIAIPAAVATAAAGLSLDFSQDAAAFAADPAVAALVGAAGGSLVPLADAQAHLRGTLLGAVAGLYAGTFGGDDSGSFRVVIDREGQLVGAAATVSEPEDVIGVSGVTESNGNSLFGNTTSGASFSGLAADGRLAGTWDNDSIGESGTYEGDLSGSPAAFLDADDVAPFVGTYALEYDVEGETGNFSATVAANGNVDVVDPEGSAVAAIVESVGGGSAVLVGVSDDGTVLHGTIGPDGSVSGTLTNEFFGETGTFGTSAP